MSDTRAVVILTHQFDPTADKVVEQLHRHRVALFRFDTAEFPEQLAVSAELTGGNWSGSLRTARRSVELGEVTGIYYWRPTGFEFHPGLSDNERRWAAVQARLGLGGLRAAVEPWLNHPHTVGFAEYKPVQLRAAVACGLDVARTVITNDPATARRFLGEVGQAIYKPFGGSGVYDTDGVRQVYATLVGPGDCDEVSIARTMHLFQEWIPKAYEVRLTVVDSQLFAARIDAASAAAHVDWRSDYDNLRYAVIDVPDDVGLGVLALMQRLGLRFGALDFVVSPSPAFRVIQVV